MARFFSIGNKRKDVNKPKKVTSIGHSVRTRFSSKNDKRMYKKYRGQGG